MRRTTIYLIIALLAFGIGLFAVVSFYLNASLKVNLRNQPIETNKTEQNISQKTEETKFICENEAIRTVWEKLQEDRDFIEDATSVIEARQIKTCEELFVLQSIDLNNDKSDEIIIKGNEILFFNSGRNSRIWIVSKFNNKYRIIFEGVADIDSDGVQVLKTKTHKFNKLKIKKPNGWEADNFGFFEFDGNYYQIKKCFENVNSAYDYDNIRGGKLISVKSEDCL